MLSIRYLLLIFIASLYSCAPRSGFNTIYKEHKGDVDFAFTIPKWAAFVALPMDVKEDIRDITRGMKRCKGLINEDNNGQTNLSDEFASLAKSGLYEEYLRVSTSGDNINLLALEEGDKIKELIVYADSDETTVLLGFIGSMQKEKLLKKISQATRE